MCATASLRCGGAALAVLAAVFSPGDADAQEQWVPGGYMAQPLLEMLESSQILRVSDNYGYDDTGICMAAAYLAPGGAYEMTRYFSTGDEYVLLARGDTDATDVDLEILDDAGNRVAADESVDRMALFSFSPTDSGEYTIRLKLYDAERAAFCAFSVLRAQGHVVALGDDLLTVARFLQMCEAVSQEVRTAKAAAQFLAEPNQAAIWGVVLRGNESASISNVDLGNALCFIMAAGDSQSDDLDVFLDDAAGNVLEQDIETDAEAVLAYLPEKGRADYTVRVKNADSGAPAFALFGVIQVIE